MIKKRKTNVFSPALFSEEMFKIDPPPTDVSNNVTYIISMEPIIYSIDHVFLVLVTRMYNSVDDGRIKTLEDYVLIKSIKENATLKSVRKLLKGVVNKLANKPFPVDGLKHRVSPAKFIIENFNTLMDN